MPRAGRQFEPVASMRITNSNKRLLVVSCVLKNMPPRKGRKKRSMMASEKPSACGHWCACVCVGGGGTRVCEYDGVCRCVAA
jgi:hypothetical protein